MLSTKVYEHMCEMKGGGVAILPLPPTRIGIKQITVYTKLRLGQASRRNV